MNSKLIDKKNNLLVSILKGTLVSVSITLILILLFALIIRFFNIADSWIFPINQIIKVISLFIGINIMLNTNKEKGFLKGLLLGLAYFFISFVIFSILQFSFSFGLNNFFDLILTTLMGGLIGIILVNIKK